MACYHPLKAWPVGVNPESGKTKYVVTGQDTLDVASKTGDPIQVPCGKCVGCRLSYSRQWADRCVLESLYHPFNYFITLTYDDEHVPGTFYGDEFGEAIDAYTLDKRDLQLFFKSLRNNFGNNSFRYFACGEYGEETFRPHYHILLFADFEITDLVSFRFERGNWYYKSDTISRIWHRGNILVGEMTWESAAYTARYCMKKINGLSGKDYEFFNMVPEFTVMSRRPGIGYQYYQDHKLEIYSNLSFSIATPKGGKKLRPSKFYDRMFDLDDPAAMQDIKKQRMESAVAAMDRKLSETDLDYQSYLAVEEAAVLDRTKKLIRGDCFEA